MSNTPKLWGVMRVVDGELCFLGEGDTFAPLDALSYLYQRRNDAYEVAQRVRGLLCHVCPKLLSAYEVKTCISIIEATDAQPSSVVVAGNGG